MEASIDTIETVLKLPESLEENTLNDTPYYIRRVEVFSTGRIVWYGYHTNWKFEDGSWTYLRNNEWESCNKPEYEKIYENLINKK